MLLRILIAVAVVILVFVVVVSTRPNTFRVERTARIAAPPAAVFALVNDFHAWEAWSPWAKRDPNMTTTYSGPPSGVGADYHWSGDRKVGEGRMTLSESEAPARIRIRLEFIKPFAGVNDVVFRFVPEGGQTQVSWAMEGKLNFATKAFSLFMSMDCMIGRDFEQGLARMKALAEGVA